MQKGIYLIISKYLLISMLYKCLVYEYYLYHELYDTTVMLYSTDIKTQIHHIYINPNTTSHIDRTT